MAPDRSASQTEETTPIEERPQEGVHLYHNPLCPYARRTRFVLRHGRVDHEEHVIRINQGPPGYREHISPYGLVPALVHDGRNVYESNIINEYLDEVFDLGLMPSDPLDKAQVRALMAYVDERWMPLEYTLKRMLLHDGARAPSDAAIGEQRAKVQEGLRDLEARFAPDADGPWLTRHGLTLADVALMTTVPHIEGMGVTIGADLPRLRAWVGAVSGLQAWREVTPPEELAPEARSG